MARRIPALPPQKQQRARHPAPPHAIRWHAGTRCSIPCGWWTRWSRRWREPLVSGAGAGPGGGGGQVEVGGGVGGGAWAVPSNWCVPARGRSAPPLSALQAQRGAGPAAAGAVQQRLWCEARRPRLVSTLPADRDPRAPAPGDGAGSVGFTRRAGATRVTHASVSAMMKEFPSAIGDGQPRRVVRPAPPPPRECLRTPRGGASSCGVRGRGLGPQGDGVWAGQAYGLHSDCSRRSTHTRQPPPPFTPARGS